MNVKFLNPFVDAANDVLNAELGVSATRGNLTMQKSAMTADDVTVLLNMVGQVQGVVFFGLSIETCLKMVSKMMSQEFTEFDTLAQSGIAELGNVITGRATIKLSQAGFQSNISPPTVIIGKGLQVSTLDFARLVVPLVSELGDITVHLALREASPDSNASDFVPLTIKTHPV